MLQNSDPSPGSRSLSLRFHPTNRPFSTISSPPNSDFPCQRRSCWTFGPGSVRIGPGRTRIRRSRRRSDRGSWAAGFRAEKPSFRTVRSDRPPILSDSLSCSRWGLRRRVRDGRWSEWPSRFLEFLTKISISRRNRWKKIIFTLKFFFGVFTHSPRHQEAPPTMANG